MFQFPGFALSNLCIQSESTWFTQLLITPKGNNSRVSGGLPHSEIFGSKPILGSPKLIAEYHVLHRLLLPRHPPNALLALDLIQKKQGFCGPCFTADLTASGIKSHTFPPGLRQTLVSVLDLDNNARFGLQT
jgi:hypothetical protein